LRGSSTIRAHGARVVLQGLLRGRIVLDTERAGESFCSAAEVFVGGSLCPDALAACLRLPALARNRCGQGADRLVLRLQRTIGMGLVARQGTGELHDILVVQLVPHLLGNLRPAERVQRAVELLLRDAGGAPLVVLILLVQAPALVALARRAALGRLAHDLLVHRSLGREGGFLGLLARARDAVAGDPAVLVGKAAELGHGVVDGTGRGRRAVAELGHGRHGVALAGPGSKKAPRARRRGGPLPAQSGRRGRYWIRITMRRSPVFRSYFVP